MNYIDETGEEISKGGGGVAFEDDGSVWIYWFDQKVEITDKFNDGICYIQLVHVCNC